MNITSCVQDSVVCHTRKTRPRLFVYRPIQASAYQGRWGITLPFPFPTRSVVIPIRSFRYTLYLSSTRVQNVKARFLIKLSTLFFHRRWTLCSKFCHPGLISSAGLTVYFGARYIINLCRKGSLLYEIVAPKDSKIDNLNYFRLEREGHSDHL